MEHKVLAVDDNNINIRLLSRTLTNNNFTVVTASSGREAIDITNSEKPDLILLDVLMPEMDGFETCKILKASNETRHIPVIFLSAKNETIDKARGLALGGSDYLTKPFDPVEIVARIRSHIAIRKDVIELSHKNEELRNKINELQDNNSSSKHLFEELKYLEKIKNINYREVNKYFQINSKVKFSNPPTTTIFIPACLDNNHFIYLISGGFEKDYKTSFVQHLLAQHVKGLFRGIKEKSFHEKQLYGLFEEILDEFSPDIYDTAFTLSINYVNAAKSEFTQLLIHQTSSVIMDSKMTPVMPVLLPVFYESRYSKIINASKIKLPPKAVIFNYVSAKNFTDPDIMVAMAKEFKANLNNTNTAMENIFSNLTDKEEDQLILSVKLM
jgi:DNA-binding response OmpR family regulator